MNTDNVLVSGETVDYGPCAFMETYNASTVFSSIDRGGRYAYGNQPSIAHWNMAWLGQSLLSLIDDDEDRAIKQVTDVLDTFPTQYQQHYRARMSQKLGFHRPCDSSDQLLIEWLSLMTRHQTDFTLSFRVLADYLVEDSAGDTSSIKALYPLPEAFDNWITEWREALRTECSEGNQNIAQQMKAINPVFIPRNHQVEAAIQAGNCGDFTHFHRLVDVLKKPFEFDQNHKALTLPAKTKEAVRQTFCGT